MSQLTIVDGMRIRTNHNPPPIAARAWDWEAWVEGEEELTCRGRTESDAVAELLEARVERDGGL